jgi:hypothetical protein
VNTHSYFLETDLLSVDPLTYLVDQFSGGRSAAKAGNSRAVGIIICWTTRFKPQLQLCQVFRSGIFNGTDGMEGAPMPVTVPKAPQVAVRVPLPDLVFAKSGGKGQPGVSKT